MGKIKEHRIEIGVTHKESCYCSISIWAKSSLEKSDLSIFPAYLGMESSHLVPGDREEH